MAQPSRTDLYHRATTHALTVAEGLRPDQLDLPKGTGTQLHLVHRGLTGPMADAHAGGWSHYLGRLAAVAEHRDPGPDVLAAERVPTVAQLGPS